LLRETEPYVVPDVTVNLLLNGMKINSAKTSGIGSYVFVVNITNSFLTTNTLKTEADVPSGKVSSSPVTLKIGSTYKTHSNSNLNLYPDLNDDLYRLHSLIIDKDGNAKNKVPFNYNSWLVYGFAKPVGGIYENEIIEFQGGIRLRPEGFASVGFTTLSGQTYWASTGGNVTVASSIPEAPHPTVYINSSSMWFSESINLGVTPPQYIIKAYKKDGTFSLNLTANGIGYPYWLARKLDNLFVGNYLDWIWGAYVQFTEVSGKLKTPQTGTIDIEGVVEIDREWHAPVVNPPEKPNLDTYYTALGGIQTSKDAMFAIWQAHSPIANLSLSQSGKLIFPTGETYSFDDYELTYGGDWYLPDWYRIKGKFGSNGQVDLYGEVKIKHNSYKNETQGYSFYQPLVNWTGTITGEGKNVVVNALGVGECTRLPPVTEEINTPPTITAAVYYTGSTNSGEQINFLCDATDSEQPSSTLTVRLWVGTCDPSDCYNTRIWASPGLENVSPVDHTMVSWNNSRSRMPGNRQPGCDIELGRQISIFHRDICYNFYNIYNFHLNNFIYNYYNIHFIHLNNFIYNYYNSNYIQ
jgi:hypothetical protein